MRLERPPFPRPAPVRPAPVRPAEIGLVAAAEAVVVGVMGETVVLVLVEASLILPVIMVGVGATFGYSSSKSAVREDGG